MRLFFALQPSPAVSAAILDRAAPIAAQLEVPLVPLSNLHATLLFLGDVPGEKVVALRAVAARVAGRAEALCFDAFDVWEKSRVLCAIATQGSPSAAALSDALRDATVAAGFAPDLKPFRPHLTLARKVPLERARTVSWPLEISPGFVVRFEEFVLMESRREEHGSIYSVVDSWPLYGSEGS